MSISILVVHAQPAVRSEARRILEQARYDVQESVELHGAAQIAPAVLLVSWSSLSPLVETLRKLRQHEATRETRILVIARRQDLGAAINSLEHGADDCIVVPFERGEVLARINACLRRPPARAADEKLSAGPIVLDRRVHQILVNDAAVELAPTEFRLMAFLLENQGRVFSRSELLRRAWRDNIKAGHRTVDVHVRRLRQQLEPFGCQNIIQTVRGFGYRLRVE